MLLLVCAGLFVQRGRKAGAIDFGFRTDDLLVLSVDPLGQGYDREQARALYRDILEDVVPLPGVESASWARRAAPLSPGPNRGNVFTLDGGTAPEPDGVRVSLNYVDSGFFDTVDIPVLRGRGFREEDTAGDRRVALVSERAARQLWPGQDAIGRRIVHGFIGAAPFEVIGVCATRTCPQCRRSPGRRSSSNSCAIFRAFSAASPNHSARVSASRLSWSGAGSRAPRRCRRGTTRCGSPGSERAGSSTLVALAGLRSPSRSSADHRLSREGSLQVRLTYSTSSSRGGDSERPCRPPRASLRPAPAAFADRCRGARTPRCRRAGAPSHRPRRPPGGRFG